VFGFCAALITDRRVNTGLTWVTGVADISPPPDVALASRPAQWKMRKLANNLSSVLDIE
jgi:hypothetical protein